MRDFVSGEELQVHGVWLQLLPQDGPGETHQQRTRQVPLPLPYLREEVQRSQAARQDCPRGSQGGYYAKLAGRNCQRIFRSSGIFVKDFH